MDDLDPKEEKMRKSRETNWSKWDHYDYFEYFGPSDSATRELCQLLVGKIWSRKEIEAIDNGETGPGTAHIVCGGTGCRHHWQSVNPSWMSESEWESSRGDVSTLVDAGFLEDAP